MESLKLKTSTLIFLLKKTNSKILPNPNICYIDVIAVVYTSFKCFYSYFINSYSPSSSSLFILFNII